MTQHLIGSGGQYTMRRVDPKTAFPRATFASMDRMWLTTVQELCRQEETGSRDGAQREILNWSATLTDPHRSLLMNPTRAISLPFAAAETLWYASSDSKIDRLLKYAPQYVKFSDDGVTAYGAYGPRIYAQMAEARDRILAQDVTRQACVVVWRPEDAGVVSKDVPCTTSMQFLLREGRLFMRVDMRSNDVWLGMPYDVFAFTNMQRCMANSLGVPVGTYTHNVGSMHLYSRNFEPAKRAADDGRAPTIPRPLAAWLNESSCTWQELNRASNEEERMRKYGLVSSRWNGLGVMSKDLLELVGSKLVVDTPHTLSEGLRDALDRGT